MVNYSDLIILHEDNHLLVVIKPAGLLTQGDSSGKPALNELLKQYLKEAYGKPGNAFVGIVHRLDQPVGGVMVFAKTSKAAGRLSEQVRSRSFRKGYLAVVEGELPSGPRTLVHFLRKDKRRNVVSVVPPDAPDAKRAELRMEPVASRRGCTLVRIDLKTGRPHQIRVQMAKEGFPLLGDRKYGDGTWGSEVDLALWAHALAVNHPTLKTPLTFVGAPPMNRSPWCLFPEAEAEAVAPPTEPADSAAGPAPPR